jgi:hypothetical protein
VTGLPRRFIALSRREDVKYCIDTKFIFNPISICFKRHKATSNCVSWLAVVDNHGSIYVTVALFVVTGELNAN